MSGLICSLVLHAQARSQADVSIVSVTLSNAVTKPVATIANPNPNTGPVIKTKPPTDLRIDRSSSQNITCSITVHNENDDDAYETELIALLPIEVNVVSKPANATLHKLGPNAPVAYISFTLGHMTVGQNITVEFTFTKSKYDNKVGAYAFSATSDPMPANNYKEASL